MDDRANDLWVFVQISVSGRSLRSCSMPSFETVCVRPANLSRKEDISYSSKDNIIFSIASHPTLKSFLVWLPFRCFL